MSDVNLGGLTLELAEEQAYVSKRSIKTGVVHIRTVVERDEVPIQEQLWRERVLVNRVTINEDVQSAPQVRQEGDLLIVPVVEEYLFVEKRLRLKEELHLRIERDAADVADTVQLRRVRAIVEREEPDGELNPDGVDPNANDHRPLR